jgi:hypothetical protein
MTSIAGLFLLTASALGADVLVVCPELFRPSLAPWIEHRTAQGHQIELISNQGSAADIRGEIRRRAANGKAKFLLLVGDAQPQAARDVAALVRSVPAHFEPAKVTIHWGSESEIATDNWYADLDDDQVPDLAVGRLTADTPAELSAQIRKIAAYENDASPSRWRERISFVAGLGGFGALADSVLEACTKKFITEGVPGGYSTSMTYASWRSPYCPHPSEFKRCVLQRFNEGCLFWIYLGHGHAHGLDQFAVPGGVHSILETPDVSRLRCAQGAPIAIFLSCHTGAYDAPQDCLAEEMLRSPGGPVAVICGSRVTMPYAMAVLGAEALKECFHSRRATIGEVLLHAKRNTILGQRSDEQSKVLDLLASVLNGDSDLEAERKEHLHLFNLIGDPLLRIPHPQSISLNVPRQAEQGQAIDIVGQSPVDGLCTVELVVRRDRLTFAPPTRRDYQHTLSAQQHYREIYERANDARLTTLDTRIVDGKLQARLSLPADARGECSLRVTVQQEGGFAMGSADLMIAPAAE